MPEEEVSYAEVVLCVEVVVELPLEVAEVVVEVDMMENSWQHEMVEVEEVS